MVKIRNLHPRSFEKVKYFPGCAGNPFDRLLHSIEKLEKIPIAIMLTVLALFAFIGGLPAWIQTHQLPLISGFLLFFFFVDWFLISRLPSTQRSFGATRLTTLMLACLRVPFAWLPLGWNLGFEIAGTLLVIYGFYIEPFQVDVHTETFETNKLPPGTSLRVLHMGDLHLERTTRRELNVLAKISELKPDLILFSGDVLNLSFLEDATAQSHSIEFFNQISAPLGVFGVTGSPAVDKPDFFSRLTKETNLEWLDDKPTLIRKYCNFRVWGLTCTHNPDLDSKRLAGSQIVDVFDIENFNLLLHHSPDLAPNASQMGFDLQLSGHTHGGQVRIPFFGALYAGSLYGKTFEAGRYSVNDMALYVTRGLGLEGAVAPRVRFLCRPEMVCWEIKGCETPCTE